MSEIAVYSLVTSFVILAGLIGYWAARTRSKPVMPHSLELGSIEASSMEAGAPGTLNSSAEPLPASPLGTDLDFLTQDGKVVLSTRELQRLPHDVLKIDDAHGVALSRGRQLAADVFKGVAGLPNKTIEIVFDPAIQRGLADGTLEIMPAVGGGMRTIARNADTKAIAGHARVFDGSRVRQAAAGAFQILSIAVAQSHLDDINRNLEAIRNEVGSLREFLDIKDKGTLAGTVDYLSEVVEFIRNVTLPDQIGVEKKVQLEAIYREVPGWLRQFNLEATALKAKISGQADGDTFGGTEATHKALQRHVDAARTLLEKRNLLLRLMTLLRLCKAYMEPLQGRALPQSWSAGSREVAEEFEQLAVTLRDKANQLLSRALFNRLETLESRRTDIVSATDALRENAGTELAAYDSLMMRIATNLNRLDRAKGQVRMAVSFNAESQVQAVALV